MSGIYGLDEAVLVDLQVIDPLQKLHESYRKLIEGGYEKQVFQGLDDAIRIFVKNIKDHEGIVWSGKSPDQRKELKMKGVKLNMNLKEIIFNLLTLAQQVLLPVEKRNSDMVAKITGKLEILFKVESGYDEILCKVKPFFELVR